jgi:hypothetical protein
MQVQLYKQPNRLRCGSVGLGLTVQRHGPSLKSFIRNPGPTNFPLKIIKYAANGSKKIKYAANEAK